MKKSKQLTWLLTGALSMATLAGCGGEQVKDTSSSNAEATQEATSEGAASGQLSGSITVLTHRTDMGDVFKTYKEKFEADHPGTEINFENVNDYQNTLSTRMGTDDYGDVLMMPANITKIQYPDFYEPMGTIEELGDTYGFLDNANLDGTIYGLSTGANALGFVYNAQVFKDAGITSLPTTPEEYIEDLKAIKEKTDAIPYYTNYVADWSLTNYSNSLQIGISGDTDYMNKMIYNENEFKEGSATYTSLKLLYDAVANGLCEEDPMTSDWEYSKQALADGKIGVMCLGSWAVGQIQALSKTPENIKFMPVPVVHDGKYTMQIASDYFMGVNVHSKNKELAKEFVKFFVQEYPNDSNMISSMVGVELPAFLSDAGNVELVEAKPGTTEQAADLEAVQKEALLSIYDGTWIKTIIEIGLGNSSQSFDDYMNSLNASWVSGIQSLGK